MSNRPKTHRLKVVTDDEIREALKYQQDKSSWNLYSEREFLENILSQRINFVIAVFALFVTAAATVKEIVSFRIILGTGALLLMILFTTTWRVFQRLKIVLKMLYKVDIKEVLPFVEQEVKALGWRKLSPMIGGIYIFIPLLCSLIFVIGFVLSWLGFIEPLGK
jgi:hypothetical protein